MARLGTADDVPLLLQVAENLSGAERGEIVRGAMKLARRSWLLVLDNNLSAEMRAELVCELTDQEVRLLRDKWVALLLARNQKLRRAALYRVVDILGKSQRIQLLEEYLRQETYFYDVVFWLDRLCYSPPSFRKRFYEGFARYLDGTW